ncbi:MAG: hypothetical protein A2496_01535, partial [Burkholderiales bacterium RIFOXYC12_FULL_60_6]
ELICKNQSGNPTTSQTPTMTRDSAEKILQQTGLRKTADRLRLIELIDSDRAWSADQLFIELGDINLSTVYRNLTALTERGILRSTVGHDGKALYELAERSHHAHLVCQDCGQVGCVPCPLNDSSDHLLEFYKTCEACLAERRRLSRKA